MVKATPMPLHSPKWMQSCLLYTSRADYTGSTFFHLFVHLFAGQCPSAELLAVDVCQDTFQYDNGTIYHNTEVDGAIDFGIVVDGSIVILEGILAHIYSKQFRGRTLTRKEMDEEVEKGASGVVRSRCV